MDPGVVIEAREPARIIYREVATRARWEITGLCTCCGLCEVGAVDSHLVWLGPPGTPGACVDVRGMNRPDVPVRPEIRTHLPGCALSGRYLPDGD